MSRKRARTRASARSLSARTSTSTSRAAHRSSNRTRPRPTSFRPRHGFAWLGARPPDGDDVPYSDFEGRIVNASLTHLGCVEVIGLDEALEPARVEFFDFDQILTLSFPAGEAGVAPFRPARILREYGHDDRVVLLPLRYGLSWFAHEPELLRGSTSHEVATIELGGLADPSKAIGNPLDRRPLGIAVGPQRLEDPRRRRAGGPTTRERSGQAIVSLTRTDRQESNMIRLPMFKPNHARAELGYWIGVPFWGRGFATEAARALVNYGFLSLQLHKVSARHMEFNPGSGRVMQKLGMQQEGRLIDEVCKDGRFHTQIVYGLLAS